jgi:hypothetical protein
MKTKLIVFTLIFFSIESFSQQTVSEKVKYHFRTSKCRFCGKIKKDNSVDWVSISNEDVSDKIYLEGLSKATLSIAFGEKETNCSGSRFGEHEFNEISHKTELKLVTAVKGSAAKRNKSYNNDKSNENTVEFDMEAYRKASGELNDNEKKSSSKQGEFDMDAFNKALKKSNEDEKLKKKILKKKKN